MKPNLEYLEGLKQEISQMFERWWNNEELTLKDRIRYYSLKLNYCSAQRMNFQFLQDKTHKQYHKYATECLTPNSPHPKLHNL